MMGVQDFLMLANSFEEIVGPSYSRTVLLPPPQLQMGKIILETDGTDGGQRLITEIVNKRMQLPTCVLTSLHI